MFTQLTFSPGGRKFEYNMDLNDLAHMHILCHAEMHAFAGD